MLKKYYKEISIAGSVVSFIAGQISLTSIACVAASLAFIQYRHVIMHRIRKNLRTMGYVELGITSAVSLFAMIYLGLGPFAPAYFGGPDKTFLSMPVICIGVIYCVFVVYFGMGWVFSATAAAGQKLDDTGLADEYPDTGEGWATDEEITKRFGRSPNKPFTHEDLHGIHIGMSLHWHELGHILTMGGAGMGKGTCIILPALLSDGFVQSGTSLVCLDPKGENAAVSARFLEKSGYEVHIIDPFNIKELKGFKKSRWHPFDLIEDGDKSFADMMAFSLHNRVSNGDNEFFNSRCRQYISLYIRYVLHYNRHTADATPLITQIYNLLLMSGDKREKLLSRMATDETFAGKTIAEGILSRLMGEGEKTEESIFTTIGEAIDILEDERIQDSMSYDDFDMRHLCKKPMAVFICIPHHQLRKYSAWVRIFTDTLLNVLNQHYSMKRKVLVLLDEFAQLGYVQSFSFAPAVLRGYNITLWPIIQNLGQLINLYGAQNFETFMGNTVVKHWFGGNGSAMDNSSARYIAYRLPMKLEYYNTPMGRNVRKVPLLSPDQLVAYSKIICEVTGLDKPIEVEKIPYWKWPFSMDNADKNPMY